MLKEQGLRLLTITEYTQTLLPMNSSRDDEDINQFNVVTSGNPNEFYLVQTSSNGYRMMPGPEFGPRLYRGQSKHYPACKPSLFRGNYQYVDVLYWTTKRLELAMILNYHPAVNDILTWDFDGLKFDFDLQAVAQHYQYPTQMLDLSRSKDVAMFFATHEFTSPSNPKPAIGNEAVIYTVDVKMLLSAKNESNRLVPVGVDPLPRSAAQKAFALELGVSRDLETMAGVDIETFLVTEELANKAAAKVGGYHGLFPYDPFEEHITKVRNNGKIPKEAIEATVSAGLVPHEYSASSLIEVFEKAGYVIDTPSYALPHQDIIAAATSEWEKRREEYTKMIRWRGTADSL